MDGQIIFYWIKEVLSNPEAPMRAQVAILFITAGIVGWYTIETYRLRKEAQKQTELQIRPFVIFKATRDDLQVRNIGNGTAINVRVNDIKLPKPTENFITIVNFPEPVPILLKDQCARIEWKLLLKVRPCKGPAQTS